MSEQQGGSAADITARAAALSAVETLSARPTTTVEFISRGRVAVIGGRAAMEFAPRLSGDLQPQLVLTEAIDEPGLPAVIQGGRRLVIEGHMGAFGIHLGDRGRANYQLVEADLVLDLSAEPLLSMPMKPLGYLVSGIEEPELSKAEAELSLLKGRFEKPRFFEYDPSICAHGRAGHQACRRCIDSCPAQAVISIGDTVEVDPFLCQGGGVCASVCPSGALSYSYPRATDTLQRIRTLLRVYREHGGRRPELAVVSEADESVILECRANLLPLVVEELASVGLEVWLSALAFGAGRVLLVDAGSVPAGVNDALRQQLQVASEILRAMGYPRNAIALVDGGGLGGDAGSAMPGFAPAGFSGVGGKRQTGFLAIDHLYEQAERPHPMVDLAVGAPFGTAEVDAKACTLCLSCVGACPGKALQQGQGEPKLSFIEANCLQCGLCTRTCPENAIWISPRLIFDREQRNSKRLLHQEPPFCCISCGKPFATRSVIDNMLAKLSGHWMFETERSRERLKMCQDCRTVDALQDPAAMNTDKTTLQ